MRWIARVLWLSLVACSPAASGPNRPVAAYGGHAADLFDDTIEARAVGLDPDAAGGTVRGDATMRERVQLGDATLRVRIDTVTTKQEETGASYQIGFRVLESLTATHPPPETFTVKIDRTSPSAGILRTYESALVGKRFVAFVRLFGRTDGEREYHFHLTTDSKDVVAAVREATILENFQK
jgi:hypothetical protein